MPWARCLSAVSLVLVLSASAEGQDKLAAFKQSLAKNQASLKQYSWVETTQVSVKGEVKNQEQKQCFYGADGKVTKEPISAPQPEQNQQQGEGGRKKGGRLTKKIVENKIQETKDYIQRVAGLVHQYVPPDPQRIQAAQSAGNVSIQPDASGTPAAVTIKDYLKSGDQVVIGLDAAGGKITKFNVSSYLDNLKDDAVTLAVMFAGLEDGTNYPAQSVLDVAAKKIQVKVTNSGYKKGGS